MKKNDGEYLTYDELLEYCRKIIKELNLKTEKPDMIYGIARGGVIPAVIISELLNVKFRPIYRKKQILIEGPETLPNCKKILIVDDQCQSGESLQMSKEDIIQLYPLGTQILTALIIFVRTSRFKVDSLGIEISPEDKIRLPWDWKSPSSKSKIVKKAISEYHSVKKKFDKIKLEDKHIQFDKIFQNLILLIQKDILRREEDLVFYSLKGRIIGAPNIEYFKRKIGLVEDSTSKNEVEVINEHYSSNKSSVVMDIIVDTYKENIFRLKLNEMRSGFLEFEMDTSTNRFSRCEEDREDPHPFCENHCALKDYDRLETIICYSFLNGLLTLLKIQNLSKHRLILDGVETKGISG